MIAVCHLVRAINGIEPFERFVQSFESYAAGADHELVMIFKGFAVPSELAPFRRRLAGHLFHEVHVPDDGFDIGAYVAAARELDHERVCFLNSFSEILAADWLRHLDSTLALPGVGLAAASGSWGSHRSFMLSRLGLPSAYGASLGSPAVVGSAFGLASGGQRSRSLVRRLASVPGEVLGYDGFPSPHLRTNALVVRRARLLELDIGWLSTKRRTYLVEAGRNSISAQMLRAGAKLAMVGRSGAVDDWRDWAKANVFWQGNQDDLLVADNQTRAYGKASPSERAVLSKFAWGPATAPWPANSSHGG